MYEDKLDGSITESEYAERCKKYKKRQAEILEQQKRIQEADENYYLTSNFILQLCKRSGALFKSSEMEERRQLIQLVVQNLSLNGRKLEYNLQKPFSEIAYFTDRQLWLAGWDDYRTTNWVDILEYPELTMKQQQKFLAIAV